MPHNARDLRLAAACVPAISVAGASSFGAGRSSLSRQASISWNRGPHADWLSPPPSPSGRWCATPLPFASRYLRRQRVELRLPETSELIDPSVHRQKPSSIHRIESSLRVRPDLSKATLPQHLEVL